MNDVLSLPDIALRRLQQQQGASTLLEKMTAFGISGPIGSSLKSLSLKHPPQEKRIAALENAC